MATKATSTTRCNPIPAAVAIVTLGGMLIGCQADSAALMYAQEAHAQKVAAWCYAYSGATTAWLQEDCVRRVWINVPASDYWIKHNATVNGAR
jgi:xanthosine utilization system XapX-like protein